MCTRKMLTKKMTKMIDKMSLFSHDTDPWNRRAERNTDRAKSHLTALGLSSAAILDLLSFSTMGSLLLMLHLKLWLQTCLSLFDEQTEAGLYLTSHLSLERKAFFKNRKSTFLFLSSRQKERGAKSRDL